MDGLLRTINPNVPKNVLIRSLTRLPTSELLQHRLALFHEACDLSLVQPDYVNLPLVGKKDAAIKSASYKLSEDIRAIISCIRNKKLIPRTIFKNGKRNKSFLSQVSQAASQSSQIPPTSPSSETSPALTNLNPSSSSNASGVTHNLTSPIPSSMEPNENIAPSSGSVANFYISRELNHLKDEIRCMKTNIAAALHSKPDINNPAIDSISNELMLVKKELSILREAVSSLTSSNHCSDFPVSSYSQFPHNVEPSLPHTSPPSSFSSTTCPNQSRAGIATNPSNLKIKSWNCRGYKNAMPYLNSLIEDNTDIIAISEHWLWPFELSELDNFHLDYMGLGQADKRLNEESTLYRGCGGVGIIWKSVNLLLISL